MSRDTVDREEYVKVRAFLQQVWPSIEANNCTQEAIAESAAALLGFPVSTGSVVQAAAGLGRDLPRSAAAREKKAAAEAAAAAALAKAAVPVEAFRRLADALCGLAERVGQPTFAVMTREAVESVEKPEAEAADPIATGKPPETPPVTCPNCRRQMTLYTDAAMWTCPNCGESLDIVGGEAGAAA